MPIYEYQCTACDHRLDKLQKMNDAPLKTCPQCQQETLKKLISAAGFQLKGTGWYVTDFRDQGKAKKKADKASGDKPSKASSPSTKDAKPSKSS